MLQTINVFTKHNKKLVLAVIGIGILITGGIIIYTAPENLDKLGHHQKMTPNSSFRLRSIQALLR